MSDLDVFIGGLLAGQIFSNSYHVDSIQHFFPDYSNDDAKFDGILMLLMFHIGGVVAGIVNIAYARDDGAIGMARNTIMWIAFIAWLCGNYGVGYSYSLVDFQYLASHGNNATDALNAKLQLDRIATFIFIDFGGGVFYWCMVGISLQRARGGFPIPPIDVTAHLLSWPIFALLIDACFQSVLAENGGYFYLNRIVAVSATVAFAARALLIFPNVVDECGKSERKQTNGSIYRDGLVSSWAIGSTQMFTLTICMSFMYIPFVTLPFSTNDGLGYIFGGMVLGGGVGGLLLSTNATNIFSAWEFGIMCRIHDICAAVSGVIMAVLMFIWGSAPNNAIVFFYGSSVGMIISWYLFQAVRKQKDVRTISWVLTYTMCSVIGISIALIMARDDWSEGAPAAVKILATIHAVILGVIVVPLIVCNGLV